MTRAPVDATCGHPPPGTQPYRRHRPERTPLYRLVQAHLETLLAHRNEAWPDERPVPVHIEWECRRYLECSILAHGFARARCGACGHDFLITFSCLAKYGEWAVRAIARRGVVGVNRLTWWLFKAGFRGFEVA